MLSGNVGATRAAVVIAGGTPSEGGNAGLNEAGRQAQTEGYDGVFGGEFVVQKCHRRSGFLLFRAQSIDFAEEILLIKSAHSSS
jgi:hypothetical protein